MAQERKIDILIVDELLSNKQIEEYGKEGYILTHCSNMGKYEGMRYVFVRYEYRILSFFLSELNNGYFADRTINLYWVDDYIPQIGDRFNPIDFLTDDDIQEYLKYEVLVDWLTEAGLEAYKCFVAKAKDKFNIYEFLKANVDNTFVAAREYTFNNKEQDTFYIWLQNEKTQTG